MSTDKKEAKTPRRERSEHPERAEAHTGENLLPAAAVAAAAVAAAAAAYTIAVAAAAYTIAVAAAARDSVAVFAAAAAACFGPPWPSKSRNAAVPGKGQAPGLRV